MDSNIILMSLATFGLPTLVVFVAGIWYWNKRSQEMMPPIEKKLNDLEKQSIDVKYQLKAHEEKLSRIEKENEMAKHELQESKKKIYDSIHQMQLDIAIIKPMPKQMDNLVNDFNSLKNEVHKFIVENSNKK